jgi:hypothetical protein
MGTSMTNSKRCCTDQSLSHEHFCRRCASRAAGASSKFPASLDKPWFPGASAYHAAKWGLEGFTESVAREVAGFGIRFTLIEPGAIRTGFARALQFASPLTAYQTGPVAEFRRYAGGGNEVYTGDPAKVASIIVDVTKMTEPPLRLALGCDAYTAIESTLQERLRELCQLSVGRMKDDNFEAVASARCVGSLPARIQADPQYGPCATAAREVPARPLPDQHVNHLSRVVHPGQRISSADCKPHIDTAASEGALHADSEPAADTASASLRASFKV